MNFYSCTYNFSVALISALTLLNYTNLGLTMVVQKQIVDLPTGAVFMECVLCHYVLLFHFYTCFCRLCLQTADNGLVSGT